MVPRPAAPRAWSTVPGGVSQRPQAQEDPWNRSGAFWAALGWGARGGGEAGGDRVLVAILGTAWTLRAKVPIVRQGVRAGLGVGSGSETQGSSGRGGS